MKRVYFIGIKGSGIISLVKFLIDKKEFLIKGSDSDEYYFTQDILDKLEIKYLPFDKNNIKKEEIDFIIYSSAYNEKNNQEFEEAIKQGIKMYSYTKYLGMLSRSYQNAICVAGTHGKTSTTALASIIAKNLDLKFSSFCGSALKEFDGYSSFYSGQDLFIAETCEYKRNFLSFYPTILIINNLEEDHMDYYKNLLDIKNAFLDYITKNLRKNASLIINQDDKNTLDILDQVIKKRPDLNIFSFGKDEKSFFYINQYSIEDGFQSFKIEKLKQIFKIPLPSFHFVLNASAVILAFYILLKEDGFYANLKKIEESINRFHGLKRRMENRGEVCGILFYDDYAHHPTEIKKTLKGIKEFYKERRLVVNFQSHTYTRTRAFFKAFTNSFSDCDILIVHDIFPSAREIKDEEEDRKLEEAFVKELSLKKDYRFYYIKDYSSSHEEIKSLLKIGDLFLTLGAGQNYKLIDAIKEIL